MGKVSPHSWEVSSRHLAKLSQPRVLPFPVVIAADEKSDRTFGFLPRTQLLETGHIEKDRGGKAVSFL